MAAGTLLRPLITAIVTRQGLVISATFVATLGRKIAGDEMEIMRSVEDLLLIIRRLLLRKISESYVGYVWLTQLHEIFLIGSWSMLCWLFVVHCCWLSLAGFSDLLLTLVDVIKTSRIWWK